METDAPKKLYLIQHNGLICYCRNNNDEDIEYTRTDVFIEKACEWLENNASNYIIEHPFSSDVDFEEDKMVEDFKNYMKGE